MRKGADCLSKWVGEAERQLRLLFEEAKNCQPSIIFFDEIDGEFLHTRHSTLSSTLIEPARLKQVSHRFEAANKNRFTLQSFRRFSRLWMEWMVVDKLS